MALREAGLDAAVERIDSAIYQRTAGKVVAPAGELCARPRQGAPPRHPFGRLAVLPTRVRDESVTVTASRPPLPRRGPVHVRGRACSVGCTTTVTRQTCGTSSVGVCRSASPTFGSRTAAPRPPHSSWRQMIPPSCTCPPGSLTGSSR